MEEDVNMRNKIMTIHIAGKTMFSPILTASGTFGYGEEYKNIIDYTKLGAIVCKSVTKRARIGNDAPRLKELTYGSLNSIGLANEGMKSFVNKTLPRFINYPCAVVVNVAGKDEDEYCEIISYIQDNDVHNQVWGWELNLSCPNIAGGSIIGYDPKRIDMLSQKVKKITKKPLFLKLPPSIQNIETLGRAAENGGADALTSINTISGMWIDIQEKKSYFARGVAGLAGAGIFPIALSLVNRLSHAVQIPIVAVGGITTPENAIQFLLAGARAIQVGSATFSNPQLSLQCYDAIYEFCIQNSCTCEDIKHYLKI